MEELESILKSIRENLTGNSQKDIKYLQGCMELYRDHPGLHPAAVQADAGREPAAFCGYVQPRL